MLIQGALKVMVLQVRTMAGRVVSQFNALECSRTHTRSLNTTPRLGGPVRISFQKSHIIYLVLGGLGLTPLQQNVLDGGRPGGQRRIGEAEHRRGTAAIAAGRFGGGRRARRAFHGVRLILVLFCIGVLEWFIFSTDYRGERSGRESRMEWKHRDGSIDYKMAFVWTATSANYTTCMS